MIVVSMLALVVLTISLVPIAQAIWGQTVFGYKTPFHCLNSLLMLNFAKGSLEEILQHNWFWAFIFIFIYYYIFIFFLKSAFYDFQQDAAISVSLQTGFQGDLLDLNR